MTAMDKILLRHSTKFPTLCTLIVDGLGQSSPISTHSLRDQTQWLLPSGDPRDDARRLYRLHTLDIYFWTQEDADLFLDTVERYLSAGQLETDRPRQQASDAHMSTVVQNLENMAVTDPAYQQGRLRDSRGEMVAASQHAPHSASTQGTGSDYQSSLRDQGPATGYAQVAYNPAAPPAPEPIKYREKTPPPPDAANGTGLVAAGLADQGQHYAASQSAPSGGYGPAQVPGGLGPQHGYASPPPSAGFPPRGSVSSQPSTVPSFAPPPIQTQNPNAHLLPQQSAAAQQYVPAGAGSSHEEDHEAPIGGYSSYSYTNPPQQPYQPSHLYQQNPPPQTSEYDVHSQVYRPTEAEAHSHSQKDAKKAAKNAGSRKHQVENIANGVDRKVGSFLSRLEKKIG